MPASSYLSTNARWYDEPKGEVHTSLVPVFATVRSECGWRVSADDFHAGLYAASDQPGVRGLSRRGYEYGPATLPYNVCRSATDTLRDKIAKVRPLPQVITSRGSWKNQKRARKMTQFIEGEFYRQRVFEKHWRPFIRDALIFGRGILHIWTEGADIRTKRIKPWLVFVDEWDGQDGEPRNMYYCRSIDRGVALNLWARSDAGVWKTKAKNAIETAGVFDLDGQRLSDDGEGSTVDRIDVVEAWHLPSRKGADDGRHVVIVQGATLVDEPWEYDYFPFVVLGYNDPLSGYWPHGLVEQLEGYQVSINEASEKSAEQHRMSGVGILVPDGAGIHDSEIRNGISILHHKAGGTPVVFDMDLVNEHTRQRPRELTQDALNDAGLSQMSVQSQKPAGVTAAVAIQALDDIETERFFTFGRNAEAASVEIGRRYIDCAKKIAKDYGDMAVSLPMRGGMLDLSWNDVYVEGVEIQIQPASALSQELPQKLQKLTDMFNTGEIDGQTFLRQLADPDLQAEIDLVTSDRLIVDEKLEMMLDADEEQGEAAYLPPSAYEQLYEVGQDGNPVVLPSGKLKPGWALRRAQQKYNRALIDKAPEFNLDLLQRYLTDGQRILDMQSAPPAPPMPPPSPPGPINAPPPPATPVAPSLPGMGIPGVTPPMAA